MYHVWDTRLRLACPGAQAAFRLGPHAGWDVPACTPGSGDTRGAGGVSIDRLGYLRIPEDNWTMQVYL